MSGSQSQRRNAAKRIILVGKPNSGKSLLFNQLTGLRQKVANFPGVTVELKAGLMEDVEVVDFPGTYSLNTLSKDEEIAVAKLNEAMNNHDTAVIACVLDATRLERSLVFAMQVQSLAAKQNKSVVFILNLIDELRTHGHRIDADALSKEIGSPVYAVSARTLEGIAELKGELLRLVNSGIEHVPVIGDVDELDIIKRAQHLSQTFGISSDVVLKRQNVIDQFLLNNIMGGVAFLVIMFFLFQSIFTWAAPIMDFVEEFITHSAAVTTAFIGPGMLSDFLNDAIFGGVGAFLVFVPQIMVLTLIIGLLEDSGYLARAALICHKPLSYFGLSGRSFIPYLSGHACAIPAIMAARTIESPRKRLVTMMTIPLMSCSARLPVYALLIAVLIPPDTILGGLIGLQGAAFFGLYFFGILMALFISSLINRYASSHQEQQDMPFILELPTYRLPHWKPLAHRVINSGKQFVKRAGPVIFFVSLAIWTLGYFPMNQGLDNSYLGMLGKWIEPVFEPMGLDWRYGVAILMSFLAREVFVGALGTLFGLDNAEENVEGLASIIQQDGLTLGAGLGLLLFYVVALQCVATVATLRAETDRSRIAWGLVIGYGALAYCIAITCNWLIS